MEQLAGEIGPQGQAAVPQKGQHLAVDREAGPPQHEGGHGQPAGHCARSGEGGDPGANIQTAKQALMPAYENTHVSAPIIPHSRTEMQVLNVADRRIF